MVGVTKIQRGNAGYWLQAVAQGGEDYYAQPGEAPGEWVGELAAQLELSGQVDADGYWAIFEGRNPRDGSQLLKRPQTRYRQRPDGSEVRVEPVLGYDVRFSAPKSVSLIYALGDEGTRARVLAILDEAVAAGIAHLEAQACMVQRGKGGKTIERGEGFVGMAFRHRMSRAGDPALHVHAVLANLTRAASDGRWLSLASPQGRSPLWTYGKSAGVVFQAEIRAGFLRKFGMGFDEVRNGYADLLGISREAIDALSTRAGEIGAWLEEHGASGPAAAQVAAYRTRDAKDYGVDVDQRTAEWIEKAAVYDLTPAKVTRMVRERAPREPRPIDPADLDAAVMKLEQARSHFDRRELLWAVADQLPEGADLASLTTAVEQVIASSRVLCIHDSKGLLALPIYTTPSIAEAERRFIEGALGSAEAGVAMVPRETVEAVLEGHPLLDPDQRAMVVRLTTAGEQVVPVAAWPGTGKTTALAAAREAWEEAGFIVIGVATARTASGELCDAGVPATSIASLLYRVEEWRAEGVDGLPRGTVVIVDEASMVSTFDLEQLRCLVVECGGKIAVVGDPRQIGAIGPGGVYASLTRAIEPSTLTQIHRQHREVDRELVALIHEGRGSEALDMLRTRNRLIVGDDLPATLNGLLADWHRDFASGADVVMIARRNRDVDYLNDAARELRREEGALGRAEVIVGERAFAAGDRVQTRVNWRGVSNRERWDVVAVDAAARTIRLRRIGGDEREVILKPTYLKCRTLDGAPALQHAYAVTIYGAQGKTFDRVYPLLDGAGSLEEQLVALSRGREVANAYAVAASELVDPDLGPGRREVSDAIHDIRVAIEREGSEFPAIEVPLRKKIEDMTPGILARRRAELAAGPAAGDPGLRDRLQRQIARGEEWVSRLAREREALEAMASPPPRELAQTRGAEAKQAERLRRNQAELRALPESAAPSVEQKRQEPSARLEAALIDRRIEVLALREVASARLNESPVIYNTLGPYPSEPAKALAWGRAAHAISTYRHRHGVRDTASALGREPRDPSVWAEREVASRQVEAALRLLQRTQERSAQQSFDTSHSIGR